MNQLFFNLQYIVVLIGVSFFTSCNTPIAKDQIFTKNGTSILPLEKGNNWKYLHVTFDKHGEEFKKDTVFFSVSGSFDVQDHHLFLLEEDIHKGYFAEEENDVVEYYLDKDNHVVQSSTFLKAPNGRKSFSYVYDMIDSQKGGHHYFTMRYSGKKSRRHTAVGDLEGYSYEVYTAKNEYDTVIEPGEALVEEYIFAPGTGLMDKRYYKNGLLAEELLLLESKTDHDKVLQAESPKIF